MSSNTRAAARILASPRAAAAGMPSYFSRLCSPRNLFAAWRAISKSNRFSKGFDERTIKEFSDHLGDEILSLCRELRERTFVFTPARGVLAEKAGGKKRPIKVPAVRDRVVLTGIKQLISTRFEVFDLDCSFGYIKNRNVGDAIDKVIQLAGEGRKYILEADIKSFFDTVDQALLLDMFTKEIRATSLRNLLEQAIRVEVGNLDSFASYDRAMFPAPESGIPQGGVLSPMLANFYLYKFDSAMTSKGFNLVRYADDFVVLCNTKPEAVHAYKLCLDILEGQLKLRMHHLDEIGAKTRIIHYNDGFSFLGIKFERGKILPDDKVVKRFKEKVSLLTDPTVPGTILASLLRLSNVIKGWGNAFARYDTEQLFQDLDTFVRESISAYLRHHGFYRGHQSLGRPRVKALGIPILSKIRSKMSN
jgi:RNA-directed DNA polymerase